MGDEVVEKEFLLRVWNWIKRKFRPEWNQPKLDQDIADAMALFLPGVKVRHEDEFFGEGTVLEFHPNNKYRNVMVVWSKNGVRSGVGMHSFRKLIITETI
jgi:hypothetical protein